MDIEYLYDLAFKFRSALEIVRDERRYGRLRIFQSFPKECCGYTSDLLAEFLVDNGIPEESILRVRGESNEEDYTHCWLMIDETYNIDITADQFNRKSYFKKYEPIPCCCITEHNTNLYEIFNNEKIQYERDFGINSYNGDIPEKLQELYNEIIRLVSKLS